MSGLGPSPLVHFVRLIADLTFAQSAIVLAVAQGDAARVE